MDAVETRNKPPPVSNGRIRWLWNLTEGEATLPLPCRERTDLVESKLSELLSPRKMVKGDEVDMTFPISVALPKQKGPQFRSGTLRGRNTGGNRRLFVWQGNMEETRIVPVC